MLSAQDIRTLAAAAGLQDIADDLAALALPSLRIEYADVEPGVGASRLGGLPDLPADVDWPRTNWERSERMAFFAQIDLADLDPAIWPGPRAGLLSFFCWQSDEYFAVDGGDAARLVLTPPGAELRPRGAPDDLSADLLLEPVAITFRPETTLPEIAVHAAAALEPLGFGWEGPRSDQEDQYEALLERMASEQGFAPTNPNDRWAPQHRLLGWAQHVQGDVMGEIALAGLGERGFELTREELDREGMRWRLLLQIEADNRLGPNASFGDGGSLFFGVPAEDLEAGRFDRVQGASQSG